jgi:TonB family protein
VSLRDVISHLAILLPLSILATFCPIRIHAFPFQTVGSDGILRIPTSNTGPIFISEQAARKMLSKAVKPEYPATAKAEGVEGTVVLKVIVGEDGRVSETACISGPRALRRAAVDAVRRWQYQVFSVNDRPVVFKTLVTLHFRLRVAA